MSHGPGTLRDGLRLAFGTLTVVPVPAPTRVERDVAGVAMVAAVLPGAVLGLAAGLAAAGLAVLGAPAGLAGLAGVGTGLLLTRFLHADGLADTVDGLVAGRSAERALEVMHRGDVGPAGAATLVVVLGGQAAAVAGPAAAVTSGALPWWALVGLTVLAWSASRAVLAVVCARGTRPAQRSGLGAGVLGSVPLPLAVVLPVLLAGAGWLGAGPAGALAVGAAVGAAGLLARHAHRRLGGLTGDVLGACVEVALLAALAVVALAP